VNANAKSSTKVIFNDGVSFDVPQGVPEGFGLDGAAEGVREEAFATA
jgi:hypothetical protein